MTYSMLIDQKFAIAHGLTIVQATTLASCMTLPTWTNTITVDGVVWYQYSEMKMTEDFPLLFSVPKRVYKNFKELADMGFIELSSFGKTKYVRFTEKCKTWNRHDSDYQSENGPHNSIDNNWSENGRTTSPKTDQKQSENGPHNYIINNNIINKTIKKEANASKENPTGFSQTDFPAKKKASIKFGFTPDNLDVRRQVIDKADSYFERLVFPYESEEFKRNFYVLMCQPKWRTSQKSFAAIQSNLNAVGKYPEEFAIELVKESIAKGWAALEYDSTHERYERWERNKGKIKTDQDKRKEYDEMMKYLNNDFD